MESEEDDPPDKDEEPGAELLVSASSVSSRSSTIVARGELDGVACADMLIDTGASVSFVRRDWAVNNGLRITGLKHPISVTLADQRTTVCTQRVRLSCMSVHGSKAAATLLVMDELSNEVIVGLSWQRAARLAITPGHPHDLLNGRPVSRSKATSTPRKPAKEAHTPAVEPSAEPIPRVRLAAALVHSMRTQRVVSSDEQRDQHDQREQRLSRIHAGQTPDELDAAVSRKLRQVLAGHHRVFTDVLPIKTAEQIAQSKQFSIVLIGDEVRPVKQRERRVSPAEVEAATQWVKDEVAAGRMEPSTSEWAAQLVIVPKRNDKGEVSGWRICGDYRNLNAVTKADAEPLPLMQMVFDQLKGMRYFSKLDLLKGFNQIPVEPKSRELMAVSTPVGLYQPTVMPFGVKNAPGSFQREMRRVLSGKLNKGVFVFIDDIIIYSRTEDEHLELIDWVLGRLEAEGYYANPAKCEFLRSQVSFLGHMVSREGLSMQQHKIAAVHNWPVPQSVKDVRAFLGLAGFYRRFVRNFASLAQPLTDLTKIADRRWWSWGPEEQRAFDTLKQALTSAPVLAHPDPQRQWTVQTDASGYALGAVLSQQQDDGTMRPVAYWSHKLNSAARNYSASERELMAIVEATKHWRQYLHGSPHPVLLKSDHQPLVYLNTKEQLGRRLNRWMEELCDLTFEIGYVKGKDNAAADALSRRSDLEEKGEAEAKPPVLQVKLMALPQVTAGTPPVCSWRVDGSWMSPPSQSLAAAKRAAVKPSETKDASSERTESTLIVESLLNDARTAATHDPQYQLMLKGDEKHDGLLRRDGLVYSRSGSVYIPNDRRLRTRLLELAHDAVGHFGRARTIERLGRHCVWIGLTKEVEDYCRSCAVCAANKSSNELPAGLLKPLPIPESPWDSVGIDFVGPLPMSKEGHDYILVLIDRFTKMAKMRACTTKITASETGRLLIDMMLDVGKLPSSIVSDRDVRFTGAAWGQLWRGLKTELKMSTAYHPQTDGQTERMNRTMQTMLRSYAEKREDWEQWLPFVAAAYNSTQQESTKRTPFELNFADERSIDPLKWAMEEGKQSGRGVSVEAERTLEEMRTIWKETRARLVLEQEKQRKYADQHRRDVKYEAGDSVYLSTRNLQTYRGKLQDKWCGPYVVTEVMSSGSAVKLDLRGELGKVNPVFHVSKLRPYEVSKLEWPGRLQPNRPAPELIDGEAEWEVESIVGKKVILERREVTKQVEAPAGRSGGRYARKVQQQPKQTTVKETVPVVWYKVKWLGWGDDDATWMRREDLPHCEQLIDEYELLMKQSDEEDTAAAGGVQELGVATTVQWWETDKQSTTRRGRPTVRCSYLSAGDAAGVRVPAVCDSAAVCGPAVSAVVQPSTVSSAVVSGPAVGRVAGSACDPCVCGCCVACSRRGGQAWTDAVVRGIKANSLENSKSIPQSQPERSRIRGDK